MEQNNRNWVNDSCPNLYVIYYEKLSKDLPEIASII